jgi:putative membrane-bound dehydrogenase-like protein
VRLSVIVFAIFLSTAVAPVNAEPPAFDINQQQSPPKPAPRWLGASIDQGKNDARLKGLMTPAGIKVEIVAEYPTVVNPVGMTFADDGTPYVLEWLPSPGDEWRETPVTITYKDGSKREVATMKKRTKDVVKTLHHSGTASAPYYDSARVILEDELPSSILLHDGWLYVSGRGSVRRYRQSQPGGAYDVKEVIAQGFCGFHHHQVSGMTIGYDGWLYITSGDDDNLVEGSDGSRATALRTGAIFRCRPDGSKMQFFAQGFRNPYRDVAFDTVGNMFHADNDNEDGSKFTGCRLMHIAEESDFGWRLFTGARCCRPDPVRAAVFGELPGKVQPLLKTGRGSPAGLLIYNDSRFPDEYRGLLMYPDVFRKLVRAYTVEPKGSTFEITHEFELMKWNDDLFRPCQMVLGPDGAIYVVDWRTNSGGAGRLWGDGEHGRIYRLTWTGSNDDEALPPRAPDSWQKVIRGSDDELLKALNSPDFSDRQKAQAELRRRGPRNSASLRKLLADRKASLPARVEALGVLDTFWSDEVKDLFIKLLDDPQDDLRRLAVEGLALKSKPKDGDVHAALLSIVEDANPAVRRAVYLAIGRIGADGAPDVLANVLSFDDGRDVYLRDGLVRAIERLGSAGMERLIALAESGVKKDLDKVVEVFSGLRSRAGAEALPTLLKNEHLTAAQRATLLKSYANYLLEPPVSVEPALAFLLADPNEPAEVKMAGLEALTAGGLLASSESAQKWAIEFLDEANAAQRPTILKALEQGRVVRAAPRLTKLVADPSRPAVERLAGIRALRVLNDKKSVATLRDIIAKDDPATDGAGLRLEALRTITALDADAARESSRGLLGSKDRPLLIEAIGVMTQSPVGAKEVAALFLANKLPGDLLPQVAEGLRRHASKDAEAAKQLTAVMKSGLIVGTDKTEIERVRNLVSTRGNAERGKALYLNNKALQCINCHRLEGVGGNVGPDLTRVWDTHSVEKLMESILEPSKEIKEGYTAYVATTKKGNSVTGLKIAQSATEVVLRDANGKDVRIAAKDLEELTPSRVSLMPEGVVAQLSYDQFIDLIAFLKSRTAQEALRGVVLEYSIVGPFDTDLETAGPPEGKTDLGASYSGSGTGPALTWQPVQAEPSGRLSLAAVAGNKGSAYALTYVFTPKTQTAQVRVGTNAPTRVWVSGKLVHEPDKSTPPAEPSTVELKQGWNAVLVKVSESKVEPALTLRFVGEGLRTNRQPVD